MIRGFRRLEPVVLVRTHRGSEGEKAVLLGPLRLIEEPVEMVRFSNSAMAQDDGLNHGAWYPPIESATIA